MKLFFCILVCSLTLVAEEQFVVGTASGYAPYVSLNAQGEYEGFDIDIANLIAKKLNKKLVIKDLGTMPSLLIALQKKKIDSVIWAVSITSERKKEMTMIHYQGSNEPHMPFLFWKNVPENIKKIEDISGIPNCTVCVESGSVQDAILQKYPSLKLRFLDKIADAIMELKYGKSFSAVVDSSLICRLQSQYPEIKILNLELPLEQQTFGFGICIDKSNEQLSSQVATIVNDLKNSGEITELEKKWNLLQ